MMVPVLDSGRAESNLDEQKLPVWNRNETFLHLGVPLLGVNTDIKKEKEKKKKVPACQFRSRADSGPKLYAGWEFKSVLTFHQ